MSVGAFVLEPRDVFPGNLYTPIAVEIIFEKYWVPAVEELNLQYVKYFSLGIDVTKENLSCIRTELSLMKEWLNDKYDTDLREFIKTRITNLGTMLDKAFELEDVIVFIG